MVNEDGRPDEEQPHEPAYDEVAAAISAAPEVRVAIRRLVGAWLASHPEGVEDRERERALNIVWDLIEDHRDSDRDRGLDLWNGVIS